VQNGNEWRNKGKVTSGGIFHGARPPTHNEPGAVVEAEEREVGKMRNRDTNAEEERGMTRREG